MVAPLAAAGLALNVAGMFSRGSARRKERRMLKKMLRAQQKALSEQQQMQMLQLQRSAKRQQSTVQSATAKSGVTMSGSALLAAMESAELAAIDAATLNASYQSEMDLARMRTRSQIRASRTNSAADLLSGASQILSGLDEAGFDFSFNRPASFGVLRSDQARFTPWGPQ